MNEELEWMRKEVVVAWFKLQSLMFHGVLSADIEDNLVGQRTQTTTGSIVLLLGGTKENFH
jgi:hypothetical protein